MNDEERALLTKTLHLLNAQTELIDEQKEQIEGLMDLSKSLFKRERLHIFMFWTAFTWLGALTGKVFFT